MMIDRENNYVPAGSSWETDNALQQTLTAGALLEAVTSCFTLIREEVLTLHC
jgi:hypothetical protein